jgi:serine-type D-Ala-D-Ala carboxypeptidase/endopeptidase (penicillin-binding protein 4)
MRRPRAALAAVLTLAATAPAAHAAGGGSGLPGTPPTAARTVGGGRSAALTRALNLGMREAGVYSGAMVADLSTGQTLYSHNATVPRLPASVEKLFTTTTALERLGPDARLTTTLLGIGRQRGTVWRGTLYLRGGGDPTFGNAGFIHRSYGSGASVQRLVAGLRARHIGTIHGPIVADASRFDTVAGTPAEGGRLSTEVEGGLSALAFDRDWATSTGSVLYRQPARAAADGLIKALLAAHIHLDRHVVVRLGRTPASAEPLASVQSPPVSRLIALTNTPSDNFFAETLLKDLGAAAGAGGTTAAGAAVVRAEMRTQFGIAPA